MIVHLNGKIAIKQGYPNSSPAWLTVWLMIIADNTLHLTINFIAITFM